MLLKNRDDQTGLTKKKQKKCMLSIRNLISNTGMKIYYTNTNKKKSGIAILISDKAVFCV